MIYLAVVLALCGLWLLAADRPGLAVAALLASALGLWGSYKR